MAVLPMHKAVQMSDCGVFIRELSPSQSKEAVKYTHQDDYYMFGLIYNGSCSISIDFKDYRLFKGQVMCVQPGQIHSFIQSRELEAFVLVVDSLFISDIGRYMIEEYALNNSPILMDTWQYSELRQLFSILSKRIDNIENDVSKEIIRNLSCSAVAIIVEAIQNTNHSQTSNKRYIDITLQFKKLLQCELYENRSPSHYAASLNISLVYLNEVINAVTGMSVTKYIQNEIILRAKRLLFYTNKNVQEIAGELGFDDCAYFTKLFSKIAGISPTLFRKKYLE